MPLLCSLSYEGLLLHFLNLLWHNCHHYSPDFCEQQFQFVSHLNNLQKLFDRSLTWGLTFVFWSEMSQQILDETWRHIPVPLRMNYGNINIPLTYFVPLSLGQIFKVHYIVLGEIFLSEEKDLHWFCLCLNKLNIQSPSSPWLNKLINKLTLQDNTVWYCFTLLIFGGPCHLSSLNQCSWDFISSESSLFIQSWKLFSYYHINMVNMEILIMNVPSQTT